jgi:hypothetical protein
MLLSWALAEPNEWGAGRPDALARKVAEGAPLTEADEDEAVRWLLAGRRGRETLILRTLGATWYEAEFPFLELGAVVLHRHWAVNHWREHPSSAPPPRTVAEMAEHPDLPESFRGNRTLDLVRMHPLILVATNHFGPCHIAKSGVDLVDSSGRTGNDGIASGPSLRRKASATRGAAKSRASSRPRPPARSQTAADTLGNAVVSEGSEFVVRP